MKTDVIQDHLNIAELISKTVSGIISAQEQEILDRWLADDANKKIYENVLKDSGTSFEQYEKFLSMADFSSIRPGMRRTYRSTHMGKRRIAATVAAAVIILLIIIGVPIVSRTGENKNEIRHQTSVARLILDDGNEIMLSERQHNAPFGSIFEQDGKAVLSFLADPDTAETGEQSYATNRIVVPRGCDYTVLLSDGTIVYLNPNSEIEFPVKFSGPVREVRMRGQAYFDVARNEQSPFIVRTSSSEVRVLGTEFDIRDYDGQPNQTTLISGGVLVTDNRGESRMLSPGQQAEITNEGMTVQDVNTMLYTARKDGYFMFRNARIVDIMEKLSEWYDSEYAINDSWLENMRITARLKRYNDINPILDVLNSLNELDFKIEGRTIIVYRNLSPRK